MAREISTWNLIVDTEKQMNKLDVDHHYLRDTSRTIQHLVEGMELGGVALYFPMIVLQTLFHNLLLLRFAGISGVTIAIFHVWLTTCLDLYADFVALHLLTPEQLQQRTDLPPQVRTFFDRYQQFLATKQELDVLVASLKGRGLEYVTGKGIADLQACWESY